MCTPKAGTLGITLLAVSLTSAVAGGPGDSGSIKDGPHTTPFSWSGFYVGAHVGHASTDADWTFQGNTFFNSNNGESLGERFDHNPSGRFGGGQVGFNQQMGRWVWGIEGLVSRGDISQSSVSPFFPDEDTLSTDIKTLWAVTGKVGYAWDRWLAYGKAGYAGGRVEISAFSTSIADGSTVSVRKTAVHHGWTIGGGVEYLLTQNLMIGVEYNYIDLGKAEYTTFDTFGDTFDAFGVDNDVTAHALMGRLSYKFGR